MTKYPSVRLFNNAVGIYKDPKGHVFRFGLAPGSSDLIGWKSGFITQEDVGKKYARFLAIEVKAPKGHPTDIQENFIRTVQDMGGLAGIAYSSDEAEAILNG